MISMKPLVLSVSAALVLVSPVAPGCGQLAPPRKAPARTKWVKWNAEDFFTDARTIALCKAIEAHDLPKIERLVKSGADVNARGRGNMTPLLWAFPVGEDVFKKLLDLGADPNVRLTEKAWPIVFEKDTSVMSASASSLVVEAGPMHDSYFGKVPMENYLRLVLEHGGNPNAEDVMGQTPLFYAHAPEKIAELLKFGADIDHRDRTGFTALYSETAGQLRGALALLRAGADYRVADLKGWDPVLRLERGKMEVEKRKDSAWAERAERSAAPVRDWLTGEGVNWAAARVALESHVDFKNLPADYKHRPWLPQRPTLRKPAVKSGAKAGH